MFYIKTLSVILFANIFSHLVHCLFVLLMVFFAGQKVLSLGPPGEAGVGCRSLRGQAQ